MGRSKRSTRKGKINKRSLDSDSHNMTQSSSLTTGAVISLLVAATTGWFSRQNYFVPNKMNSSLSLFFTLPNLFVDSSRWKNTATAHINPKNDGYSSIFNKDGEDDDHDLSHDKKRRKRRWPSLLFSKNKNIYDNDTVTYDIQQPTEISSKSTVHKNEIGSDEGKKKAKKALERGKFISEEVTSNELYQAYLDVKNEYQQKAFNNDDDFSDNKWTVLKETDDGVQIAMLSHPSDPSCPYVRMSAVMPGSIQDVWDFLQLDNWEETMPHMDPFYEGLTVLGKYHHNLSTDSKVNAESKKKKIQIKSRFFSKNNDDLSGTNNNSVEMILARKRTKRLLTFGKRDFTFVSVSDVPQSDGIWVSGTVSVISSKLPRKKSYTRAFQDSIAFYKPLPPVITNDNGISVTKHQTALTIVCRIDLNDSTDGGEGGGIPMWIYVKTIGTTGVLSIQNMRKQLLNGFKKKR